MNNHFLLFESYNGNEYKYLGAETGNAKDNSSKAWQLKQMCMVITIYRARDVAGKIWTGGANNNLPPLRPPPPTKQKLYFYSVIPCTSSIIPFFC